MSCAMENLSDNSTWRKANPLDQFYIWAITILIKVRKSQNQFFLPPILPKKTGRKNVIISALACKMVQIRKKEIKA